MGKDLSRVGLRFEETAAPTIRHPVVIQAPDRQPIRAARRLDEEVTRRISERVSGAGGMTCEPLADFPSVIVAALKPPAVPWSESDEEAAWERLLQAVQEDMGDCTVATAVMPRPTYLGDRILIGDDPDEVQAAYERFFA